MHSTSQPIELVAVAGESPPDPYSGTPLGVEAAWFPNGIDAQLPAATETALRLMERRC